MPARLRKRPLQPLQRVLEEAFFCPEFRAMAVGLSPALSDWLASRPAPAKRALAMTERVAPPRCLGWAESPTPAQFLGAAMAVDGGPGSPHCLEGWSAAHARPAVAGMYPFVYSWNLLILFVT